MFFNFSNAFNNIQPSWPQFVRADGCVSEVVISNTGASQETILVQKFLNSEWCE